MNTLTSLSPASQNTQAIFHLWMIAMAIFGLIFLLVTGLIVYSLMKYRWREGEPDPEQVAGQHTVEMIWTAIPLGIVVLLFVLTVKTMGVSDPRAGAQARPHRDRTPMVVGGALPAIRRGHGE